MGFFFYIFKHFAKSPVFKIKNNAGMGHPIVAPSMVFLCYFDIKLLHHFDIINRCLSNEKRNDH
jgi:hypothetical protein